MSRQPLPQDIRCLIHLRQLCNQKEIINENDLENQKKKFLEKEHCPENSNNKIINDLYNNKYVIKLIDDIQCSIGERVGESTLKRMLWLGTEKEFQRKSYCAIAQYISDGRMNWADLLNLRKDNELCQIEREMVYERNSLNASTIIRPRTTGIGIRNKAIQHILARDIPKGYEVDINLSHHQIRFKRLAPSKGEDRFRVVRSNSKILKRGVELTIHGFFEGINIVGYDVRKPNENDIIQNNYDVSEGIIDGGTYCSGLPIRSILVEDVL